MKLRTRMLVALLLFSLLGAMGYSQPKQAEFDPEVLNGMSPERIGTCNLTSGITAYCELYKAPNNKQWIAIYMPFEGSLLLVAVKEVDGNRQRNIWLHPVAYI